VKKNEENRMKHSNFSYHILKGVGMIGLGFLAILLINAPVMAENYSSSPVSSGIPDQSAVQKYTSLKAESTDTIPSNVGNDSVEIQTIEQENEIDPITIIPNGTANGSLVMWILAHKWEGYTPNKSAERNVGSDNRLMTSSVGTFASTNTEPYTFAYQWGTTGSGSGQFYLIQGIAIDSSDNVYVTDVRTPGEVNSRVQKFKPDGTFITQWGTNGSGIGQFYLAEGIGTDTSDNVYVADTANFRIQKFSSSGEYITQWGTYGTGNGQFSVPENIATDAPGNVYVTEMLNERVQKFNSDGGYFTKWGTYGSGNGQFHYPGGISTDATGNVYVTDIQNHRVQKFSSTGAYISQWGTYGMGDGQLDHPHGVAVDKSGNVFVSDSYNDRIQMFSTDGIYLGQWGTYGSGFGEFDRVDSIAVNSLGYVYVSDNSNRIQVFKPVEKVVTKTFSITNAWVEPKKEPPFESKYDSKKYIENINKELKNDDGWVQAFPEINGTNIKKAQFGVNPTSSDRTLNDAFLHWHIGHGGLDDQSGHTGIAIPIKYNESTNEFDNDLLYASEVTTKWGGNNKWVVLQDCWILKDPDWGNVLGTTHGIFGFTTPTDTKSTLPSKFLQYAKSGNTLYDSWYSATNDLYYDDVVGTEFITGPDGKARVDNYNHTVNVSAALRFKTKEQLDNDHLPGIGKYIAPDGDPNNLSSIAVAWDCHTGERVYS
jgi:hypothetical protein